MEFHNKLYHIRVRLDVSRLESKIVISDIFNFFNKLKI